MKMAKVESTANAASQKPKKKKVKVPKQKTNEPSESAKSPLASAAKHEEVIKGKYAKGNKRRSFPPSGVKPNRQGKVVKAQRKKPNTVGKALPTPPSKSKEAPDQPKEGKPRPGDGSAPTKRKHESEPAEGADQTKKVKLEEMTKKQRKFERKKKEFERKKKDGTFFETSKAIKQVWEDLRRKACSKEKRAKLLTQLTGLVKGRVKELIFAHDTARVIECMGDLGTPEHRNLIFEEVKDMIVPMSKSKYAKFIVRKMLKNGTPQQKEHIVKAFNMQVVQCLHHAEAASVLETIYNEHANAVQRSQLLQEFYCRDMALFKEDKVVTFKDALEKSAQPAKTLEDLKEILMKIVGKPVLGHSIIHHVFLEFFKNADENSRSEMIRALGGSVIEMLHTKDGSRVAMQCLWHGTAKDRKAIVKSFKTHVVKIAKEEHGHMVLLAAFDCVDDTKLVDSTVTAELLREPLELMTSASGQKVLSYLVAPRDPRVFHPSIIEILKEGDASVTSKKDPQVRREELRKAPAAALAQLIADNAELFLTHNGPTAVVASVILTNLREGEATEAFRSIARLLANSPYEPSTDPEKAHLFDRNHARFFLKKMTLHDRASKQGQNCFSAILVDEVPKEALVTWIGCNFGAFLLVNLLETGVPEVVRVVKEALAGKQSLLKKSELKGCEALREKLKEV
ncbi:pumilio homolog 3 [Ixodes scapularis]